MIEIEPLPTGSLEFHTGERFPTWTNTKFIEQWSIRHLKLVQLQRICKLTSIGVTPSDFAISTNSVALYTANPYDDIYEQGVLGFETGDDPGQRFWEIFRSYKRPVMFYRDEYDRLPLYGHREDELFRLERYREKKDSLVGTFSGAFGGLLELTVAGAPADLTDSVSYADSLAEFTGLSPRLFFDTDLPGEIIRQSGIPDSIAQPARALLETFQNEQEEINQNIRFEPSSVTRH